MKYALLAVALSAPAAVALAQPEPEAFPEPPAIPPASYQGETVEPEVTIIKRESEVIHEYRMNGELYMVKIVPQFGFPYYLVDRDVDFYYLAEQLIPFLVTRQIYTGAGKVFLILLLIAAACGGVFWVLKKKKEKAAAMYRKSREQGQP